MGEAAARRGLFAGNRVQVESSRFGVEVEAAIGVAPAIVTAFGVALVATDGRGLFRTQDPHTLDGRRGGTVGFVVVPHVILPGALPG